MQLNILLEITEDSSIVRSLVPIWRAWMEIWLQASAWPRRGYYRCLRSKLADGKSLVSLVLYFLNLGRKEEGRDKDHNEISIEFKCHFKAFQFDKCPSTQVELDSSSKYVQEMLYPTIKNTFPPAFPPYSLHPPSLVWALIQLNYAFPPAFFLSSAWISHIVRLGTAR